MRTVQKHATATRVRGTGIGRQLMSVDAARIAFVGPMGTVLRRTMGALTVYVSIDQPFGFQLGQQDWQETSAVVVPPFAPHGFMSSGQPMAALMIEPEASGWGRGTEFLEAGIPALRTLLRGAYQRLLAHETDCIAPLDLEHCQQLVLSRSHHELDPRIASAVSRVRAAPHRHITAAALAEECGLSFSRFVHLFREQTGITYRSFIAWKRARAVLETLEQGGALTDIALDTGYPDLSYFSNTVRNAYGLPPREMFARCAQATVKVQAIT